MQDEREKKKRKKKRNEETIETNSFCEKDTVKKRERERERGREKKKGSKRGEERQPRTLTYRHHRDDGIDRSPNAAMRRCHPNGQQPLWPNQFEGAVVARADFHGTLLHRAPGHWSVTTRDPQDRRHRREYHVVFNHFSISFIN